VPMDHLLSLNEMCDLLRLHVHDVPGANIFARRSNGSLMTPSEQLDSFEAEYGGAMQRRPLAKDIKINLGTRGLDRNLAAAASCERAGNDSHDPRFFLKFGNLGPPDIRRRIPNTECQRVEI
jgi:hypothetical protein